MAFRERTRATKYQQKYPLPPNFAQVLKDYTREVLREQPEDIPSWSAEYFKRLALDADPLTAKQPPPEHYAPSVENPELEVVAMRLSKVFAAMDDDGSGRLFIHLIKRALLDSIQLTKPQALYVLSSEYVAVADDGTTDYREFARDCVNAVLFFQQTNHQFPEVSHVDDGPTVHGLLKEELQDELLRVMRQADAEGLGRLPFARYREALMNAPLQLTQRDVNLLCAEAEQTSDGFIDFRIEVDNAFGLLYLAQSFAAFDEENL
uniref:RIIa domain-containing protein n=1 Tax=Neobodo designis TaxID=312471 RepID=A0A7S1Q9X2_NEODS|mmetsp:Transcript_36186/g.111498  ORF Transcript_36186/g.111498 Transcript_36186/m.111498 type:complete len:263 (+) Transcript_36186:61-849(+)|eukprot:CAMPEP_0174826902 /NCGR_PEP_ID=MMETSP1114-20130205/318_1 /TAXON_ID=312471 /ORGANISM="Neobodo designis, Strain CCAP 1951/1" /LENGTH=262 /DNA_ID=CAMNT_0016060475 /DNA_START=58 /DNA_END=846 /DNA_ORIENTATION=+